MTMSALGGKWTSLIRSLPGETIAVAEKGSDLGVVHGL